MAIDREEAKAGIEERKQTDPELNQALSEAKRLELELAKENNAHQRQLAKDDRGFLGGLVGNERSASSSAAMCVILFGLILAGFCFYKAQGIDLSGTEMDVRSLQEFWERQIERCLALVATALAFVFGRSSSSD